VIQYALPGCNYTNEMLIELENVAKELANDNRIGKDVALAQTEELQPWMVYHPVSELYEF
jgi:hypothetical protein